MILSSSGWMCSGRLGVGSMVKNSVQTFPCLNRYENYMAVCKDKTLKNYNIQSQSTQSLKQTDLSVVLLISRTSFLFRQHNQQHKYIRRFAQLIVCREC